MKNQEAKMGWRYLAYQEGKRMLIFNIEPMVDKADLVYLPTEKAWQGTAPKWAKLRRDEIITFIKKISWNRRLDWLETDINVIEKGIKEDLVIPGSLESTEAGREFESYGLFNPGNEVSPEEAHELWCQLETKFAEQASGLVRIFVGDLIPGSVFEKISLPTLKKNSNVKLEFIQ
jgi:hypothetical protein